MKDRFGILLSLALIIVTIGYGLFQARTLLQGPTLMVKTPTPGSTQTETLVQVTGSTHNATHIELNGRTILTDPHGNFSEVVVTPHGYGVLLVEARNRFGYTAVERIDYFGTPPAPTEQG